MNQQLPDQHQRQRALDPHRSLIVQAPAGSGKTELLIQRCLALLGLVQAPEEILAITFTKKAAHEMRARVIRALQDAQNTETVAQTTTMQLARKVLIRNQEKNWHLLQHPNRLRIQTIDSFNAHLTKQLPLLSHMGHGPRIANHPIPIYREAVQETLSHLESEAAVSEAIAHLLLHVDNEVIKLEKLLIDLLMKRDQWLPYILYEENDQALRQSLEFHLNAVISEHLILLRKTVPKSQVDELLRLARYAASNLKFTDTNSTLAHCEELHKLPGTEARDKILWQALADLLLTKEGEWRKQITVKVGFPPKKNLPGDEKSALIELISQFNMHPDFLAALAAVRNLPDHFFQEGQWKILSALIHVLKMLVAELRLCFQRHGQIDYIENAQAALLALGSDLAPTDLALALDYRIQHILVDEFQDTSYTQYRLLEKLIAGWQPGDGRTLFIVGDPMQSIYRFREAEVGLFIRASKNGIGHFPLEAIALSVNFRSAPKLIEWFNDHFSKIFPSIPNMATGAVSYHTSSANPLATKLDYDLEPVTLQPFIDAPNHAQAESVVTKIKALKQQFPQEKIAILVRSRNHLTDIIPLLKKEKLAYRAIDIDPLQTRQTISDLHALTRALLHPADRLAWLACLRAPWCGLSLHDLWIIAHKDAYVTIWEQLMQDEVRTQLSTDGQSCLARILPILQRTVAERTRHRLRHMIESTWLLLGGAACLQHEDELEDVEAFFQLLDQLDEGGSMGKLEQLDEAMQYLFAAPDQTADDSLQIMTIHAAKGLEFDTVILPHIEQKMPFDDKALLSWMEQPLLNKESALLLAPLHAVNEKNHTIYDYIRRQQKIKSDYETTRLLYVAATRAKKRLIISFDLCTNAKNEIQDPQQNSFLNQLWPVFDRQSLATNRNSEQQTQVAPTMRTRYLRRLKPTWVNPIIDIPADDRSKQKKSGFHLPVRYQQIIGTLVHRLLQQIAEQGHGWWQSNQAKRNHIKKQLLGYKMVSNDLDLAIAFIQETLDKSLQDHRGAWILAQHKHACSELALTAVIDQEVKSLVIDRTFIDKEDTRWIIDFKTSTPNDHITLEEFLDTEQKKYQQQLAHYGAAITALGETKRIKYGLYFPAIPAWREWSE